VAGMLNLATSAHASANALIVLGCCHRQLQRTPVKNDQGLSTRAPLPKTWGLDLGSDRTLRQP
jgi:hypothetical protein